MEQNFILSKTLNFMPKSVWACTAPPQTGRVGNYTLVNYCSANLRAGSSAEAPYHRLSDSILPQTQPSYPNDETTYLSILPGLPYTKEEYNKANFK